MIKSFPKIFAIGTDYIADIFDNDVEITEKVDGSQFAFGRVNGELYIRSKGAMLYSDNPEKMFAEGIDWVGSVEHILPDDTVYYCEYLKKPKHNTLAYNSIPTNHLALFGVCSPSQKFTSHYRDLLDHAMGLGIDIVPLIFDGKINSAEELLSMMDRESYLGGAKIEGLVVKNYTKQFLLGGQPMPLMAGKYVSEAFKEVHKGWSKENTGRGKFDLFKTAYRTEARWHKSVQHLRDAGQLENDPRDIGKLIKAIQQDIAEEEMDNIKNFLWNEFGKEIIRTSVKGFPEWYKEHLVKTSFEQ